MKETVLAEIETALSALSNLEDKIEILAQVFIIEGARHLPRSERPDRITVDNVVKVVLDSKKRNGETIGTALMSQGLVLLSWLESKSE